MYIGKWVSHFPRGGSLEKIAGRPPLARSLWADDAIQGATVNTSTGKGGGWGGDFVITGGIYDPIGRTPGEIIPPPRMDSYRPTALYAMGCHQKERVGPGEATDQEGGPLAKFLKVDPPQYGTLLGQGKISSWGSGGT